jgi:hypothetical protein
MIESKDQVLEKLNKALPKLKWIDSASHNCIENEENKFFDFFIELRESYVNRTLNPVYFAEIRSHDTLIDSSNNIEGLVSIIREQLHKEALEIISTVKEVADL